MTRITIAMAVALLTGVLLLTSGSRTTAQQAGCSATAGPGNLQARIDAAAPGSVVCLDGGVYQRAIIYRKDGVTVRGAGQHRTIFAGGANDALVILESRNIAVEDATMFLGNPGNVYVGRSANVALRRLDIGGGNIGVHFDDGSSGSLSDSFVYAMAGDGVLVRRNSAATVERNWIFANGGVGVSSVGQTCCTWIVRNIISDNRGPGVFAGAPPCALLPPASVDAPPCFLQDPARYVGTAQLVLDTNVIQANSPGVVLFPGTSAGMRGNRIWRNRFTGTFAWGAGMFADGDQYDGNEENAIELRAYPQPLIASPVYIPGGGVIRNTDVLSSQPIAGTAVLGGGIVNQGAWLDLRGSRVLLNRSIGVAYLNGAWGAVDGNTIAGNGGSGLCIDRAGEVAVSANAIFWNAADAVGACVAP